MATIPDCRDMLLDVHETLRKPFLTFAERKRLADRILLIVSEMYRRPAQRRAPRKARGMTPAMSKRLAKIVASNPDIPLREIGAAFGVDGGRASEAYSGKRT